MWGGTLYADFAEVCRKGNHLPYEFLIESFKTVMGAVMGSSVKVEDSFGEIEGATPRFYTVLLADGMGGKGTSISYGTQVFEPPTGANGVGLVVPQSPLWSGNDEPLNTWTGCGAARTTFNSIPGLGQLSRQHRILQTYGELSQLMNSIGNEVAGDGLLAVLRDLYDDTRYEVGATARRGPLSGHVEHSILAGTTPKLWGVMFSKKQVGGSGLFQRFNLIPVETVKRTTLHRPNLLGIRTRLYEMLLELNGAPVVVHATAAAITMLDEWFRPFGENPELLADDFGRLNVLALRNALHLAFMKGTRTIGVSEMSDAIKLSEYQFRVRTRYRPATGHNDSARLEDEVRQMVKGVRKITLRDLKRKLREHGKWALDHAIKNLVDDKELTVHEKTPAHGGPKTIWLLYEADTSRSTG